jgi:signal peptidase I
VSCVDGRLIRNGVPADEPYLPEGVVTDCSPVVVAPGTVSVRDNRAASVDSRRLGPIATADVFGRAVLT